jgi:virginiamycin B lyase
VWFTSSDATTNAGFIGRITPTGQITEFPIAASGSSPQAITVGPDGALWFADSAGSIGRITAH